MKRTLSFLMSVSMAAAMLTGSAVNAEETNETETRTLLEAFEEPTYIEKPMARFAIADATAGMDDDDVIEEWINSMADAGFGGVEVVFLTYNNDMTNEQASYAGWGTESWRSLLKKIFKAANAVEGGFLVDLTMTANWPGLINTIDANDPESSQETSVSYTKITAEDLENGKIQLTLPETKTQDGTGFFGTPLDIEDTSRFIFTDTLVSANIVQVADVTPEEDMHNNLNYDIPMPIFAQCLQGMDEVPEPYTLDYQTLGGTLATEKVTLEGTEGLSEYEYRTIDGVIYAGSPAGVPDEEYCEMMEAATGESWNYADVVDAYGEAPAADADLSGSYNGKMDSEFRRARLADWQYHYAADLTDVDIDLSEQSEGDEIKAGDWIVVSVYRRGTGQKYQSPEWGANQMVGSTWVTDMFSEEGTTVIQDYWEKYILDDELLELMAANQTDVSCFFEDSIETYCYTHFWSPAVTSEKLESYTQYPEQMAAAVAATFTNTVDENGTDIVARINEDYADMMGDLFLEGRIATGEAFAEKYDRIFRMETYGLIGFDVNEAAALVGLGENEGDGDTARLFRGSLNMADKDIVSMEAMTVTGNYRMSWETLLIDLLSDLSAGNNRTVWHACAYNKALNGFAADWPGWDPFENAHGEAWGPRQIYWNEMNTITGRIARIQAVMQEGTQKPDLVIMRDSADLNSQAVVDASDTGTNAAFRGLLNKGYSYNIISENILDLDNAAVEDGVLYEDGPAYKAMILNNVSVYSVEAAEKLIAYADAGLPIILLNTDITRIHGTGNENESDALVTAAFERLTANENVYTAASENDILAILEDLGIESYASYDLNNVETTLYRDEANDINIYYIYNNASPTMSDPTDIDVAALKESKSVNDLTDIDITLTGTGTPYFLDSVTGAITQATEYTVNDNGTVTVHIDSLESWDQTLIALTDQLETEVYVTGVDRDSSEYDIVRDSEGALALETKAGGIFNIETSDGEKHTVNADASGDTITLDSAEMTLFSYGPTYEDAHLMVDELGIQTVDPSETTVTEISLGERELNSWLNLEVTDEQLQELGVTGMEEVSGKMAYTFTFDCNEENGYLEMTHGNDQIVSVTLNGVALTALDPITDKIDLSAALLNGENTLEIVVASTLYNRALVEEYVYEQGQGTRTMFQMTDPFEYGITAASITTYSKSTIE